MKYYLKYNGKLIGPIAPDNPKHDFSHPNIHYKALDWAKQLSTETIKYEVIIK